MARSGSSVQFHFVSLDPAKEQLVDADEVVVFVKADESIHAELEGSGFDPLLHPLSSRHIRPDQATKLARRGVFPDSTAFDVSEALRKVHPLMGYRAL